MALQQVFTPGYVQHLKNNIKVENYRGEAFPVDERQVKSIRLTTSTEGLGEFMAAHADDDFACGVKLYEALAGISPILAQDDRLWVYLSHTILFPYLQRRWPLPEDDATALKHIQNHWFRSPYGVMRSAIMGLWWAVKGSAYPIDPKDETEPAHDDPYELTRVLFGNYSLRTVYFGATELFRHKEAAMGILMFLKNNPEIMNEYTENRIRFISRYFNQLGGVKLLTSQKHDYFLAECERIKPKILEAQTRDDVQNQNIMAGVKATS